MEISILIIFAPFIYLVLGTVFGILLTLLPTRKLELKIILLTFLRPIAYTYIIAHLLPYLKNSWIWLCGFAAAIVLRDILFGNHKFLLSLTVQNKNASLKYINKFLQKKSITVPLADTADLKLSDMKSIASYPVSLEITDVYAPLRFLIMTRDIWDSANKELNAANKGLHDK